DPAELALQMDAGLVGLCERQPAARAPRLGPPKKVRSARFAPHGQIPFAKKDAIVETTRRALHTVEPQSLRSSLELLIALGPLGSPFPMAFEPRRANQPLEQPFLFEDPPGGLDGVDGPIDEIRGIGVRVFAAETEKHPRTRLDDGNPAVACMLRRGGE